MLLRRYHDTSEEPDTTEADTTEDAPQAKPAGRSTRKKGDA
ncbi:hypothetical protein ACFRU3_42775 [Streptomyces sp. NPDC056910]|uniref:Uncharacterized protein n=1 Tax=Streptomyces aureus TaxID=193461 RepID=A0ABV4SYC5_9ACTN